MKSSIDIPTWQTTDWVDAVLGSTPRRILEVGCGHGEVAHALVRRGHDVLAIDRAADCVAATAARGVRSRTAEFPHVSLEPGEDRFDCVLFSRVLHHLHDLNAVCRTAGTLVGPRGFVLLEDMAWEAVDSATAAWARGLVRMARGLGAEIDEEDWSLAENALTSWRLQHEREGLHGGATMLTALADRFCIDECQGVPYAYRWFARDLQDSPHGFDATAAVLATETEMIDSGTIVPVGLRAVARLED